MPGLTAFKTLQLSSRIIIVLFLLESSSFIGTFGSKMSLLATNEASKSFRLGFLSNWRSVVVSLGTLRGQMARLSTVIANYS